MRFFGNITQSRHFTFQLPRQLLPVFTTRFNRPFWPSKLSLMLRSFFRSTARNALHCVTSVFMGHLLDYPVVLSCPTLLRRLKRFLSTFPGCGVASTSALLSSWCPIRWITWRAPSMNDLSLKDTSCGKQIVIGRYKRRKKQSLNHAE